MCPESHPYLLLLQEIGQLKGRKVVHIVAQSMGYDLSCLGSKLSLSAT